MTTKDISSVLASPIVQAAADHLWQSTAFAVLAALFALLLRRNSARVRYWVWLAASLKFLVPFSLLIGIGSLFAQPHQVEDSQAGLSFIAGQLSQPFTESLLPATPPFATGGHGNVYLLIAVAVAAIWFYGAAAVMYVWVARWRQIAGIVQHARPAEDIRLAEALRRVKAATGQHFSLEVLVSEERIEPGIFGVRRPVLLWPSGLSEQLTDAQLEAVLAHELEHVRRRDNFAAMLQMLVQIMFWFHPVVWWIGSRLVAEREKACDQRVLQLGNASSVYAESILKICTYCLGSQLPCVAGISGADLKQRVVQIMSPKGISSLSSLKKFLLVVSGCAVVAGPVLYGSANESQKPSIQTLLWPPTLRIIPMPELSPPPPPPPPPYWVQQKTLTKQ